MKRLLHTVTIFMSVAALAACAAAMTVSSHVERGLDFAKYQTFAWGPADALPTGDPRLDQDPFFKDHVQGAVEKQLALRGVEVSARAVDLLIHYHANITRRLDLNQVDRVYRSCTGADCLPGRGEYEAGTLVIDIIDARTSRLIWRGWAQNSVDDMLHDRDRMARTIEQAVTRILQRLPPAL